MQVGDILGLRQTIFGHHSTVATSVFVHQEDGVTAAPGEVSHSESGRMSAVVRGVSQAGKWKF